MNSSSLDEADALQDRFGNRDSSRMFSLSFSGSGPMS